MNAEVLALYAATFSVAFFHTMSPDHWMPFVMFGKAKKWPILKTELVALLAGIGHVGTSVIIAVVGIVIGSEISKHFASIAEVATGSALILFGFGYALYMWRKGGHVHFTIGGKYLEKSLAEHEHKHEAGHEHSHEDDGSQEHSHSHADAHEHEHEAGHEHTHNHGDAHEHSHEHEAAHAHSHPHDEGHEHSHTPDYSVALQTNADGLAHVAEIHSHAGQPHTHDHEDSHAHSHEGAHGHVHAQEAKSPYALVVIMGLTPCVALLPMAFAASTFGTGVTVATISLFAVSTLIPILGLTFLGSLGLGALKLNWFEKYGDIITGVVIGCIGLMTMFLGL